MAKRKAEKGKTSPRPVSLKATFYGLAALLRAQARDLERTWGIPARRPR